MSFFHPFVLVAKPFGIISFVRELHTLLTPRVSSIGRTIHLRYVGDREAIGSNMIESLGVMNC
jgi:hypothetical protein